MTLFRLLCAATALYCVALSPAFADQTAAASGDVKRVAPEMSASDGCTVPTPRLDSQPEWSASKQTMAGLVATGKYEIRGAYRLQICGFGLSVYVLQNARDLGEVYECVSDDRYRPAFPCQQLTGAVAEKKKN